MPDIVGLILQALFALNILFIFTVVFVERKTPAATWAWVIVVTVVPYFGFILYLLFGVESRKHKAFMKKSETDAAQNTEFKALNFPSLFFLNERYQTVDLSRFIKADGARRLNDLTRLNNKSADSPFSKNNKVKIFTDGGEKFAELLADINNACYFIHLQYFIVRNSEIAQTLIAALAKKARTGVSVRFLVDGLGSVTTKKKLFKPLLDAGGELTVFAPPRITRINYRNHRKIAVIDGLIGYVGGLNVGDEYMGKVKRFGHWRDTHLRIYGDAVKSLHLRFIMDYNFAAQGEKIPFRERDFPKIPHTQNGVCVQIVSSGPDTKWAGIHYAYAKMIFEADKSIFITTPYFVPDDTVFTALKIAALSGVDVRVIVPARPDHIFVYWASLSYLGELLPAGVKFYTYHKGFIHAKTIVIDTLVSSVGTANMDIRSFNLNFEINAFLYDQKTAQSLEEAFIDDLTYSAEITEKVYNARSAATRFRESVSRLISPLL